MLERSRGEKGRTARTGRLGAGVSALVMAAVTLVGPSPLGAQDPPGETGVGGGLYLFHYQPVDLEGAESNTEVYAAFVTLDHRVGPWRAFVQGRARDTRLRDFFPGNVWFQEAWASYRMGARGSTSPLTLRAGKMYQTLGRFWDDSFFGNVHYFDGLKLNPQFGLEASGEAELGRVGLAWSAQLLLSSDRVSGAFTGRDFETLDGHRDQYGLAGRLTAALPGGVTLGASALSRRFETPEEDVSRARESFRALHLALDGEVRVGSVVLYGEAMVRDDGDLPGELLLTQAGSGAMYWLAGVQRHGKRLHLRYNYSLVDYESLGRREWIHQPGLTFEFSENLSGLVEVDLWKAEDEVGRTTTTLDQSLNVVLLLHF